MRRKAQRKSRWTVKRLLRLIIILFIILNWLFDFVLKAVTLWDRLFG